LGAFLFVAINDRLVQFRGEKLQEDDVTVVLAVVAWVWTKLIRLLK